MSDVKKFTGFIAIDGSTHNTLKAATEHTRQVKIQRALAEKFTGTVVMDSTPRYDEQEGVDMPTFIYANRATILACLNQEVQTRKKRAPNKPKVEGAAPAPADASAVAPTPAPAPAPAEAA